MRAVSGECLGTIVEQAVAPEFGALTSKKVVPSEPGIVPRWKVRSAIRNFLQDQIDIKEREKERARVRDRDAGNEKFRRIVDGRSRSGAA